MKKLMVVIFIFIILLAGKSKHESFTLLDYFSGKYTVYTSVEGGKESIDLGFCYMKSKPTNKHVLGESIEVENLEVGSVVKVLNAHIIKTEYLEDGTTTIYAHTNLIDEKVQIAGRNVNLQLAIKDNVTIIGWPLILGSY